MVMESINFCLNEHRVVYNEIQGMEIIHASIAQE